MCFTQIEKNTNSKNQKYILENTCLEIHSEGVLDPNWKDGATSFPEKIHIWITKNTKNQKYMFEKYSQQ